MIIHIEHSWCQEICCAKHTNPHPGITYGATDDLGYAAVENPVHVHDLHATMLYLFGIEHTKLTYRFQGHNFHLTDVSGNVVKDILS